MMVFLFYKGEAEAQTAVTIPAGSSLIPGNSVIGQGSSSIQDATVVGQVNFPAGTFSSPAITFNGKSSHGFYSPGIYQTSVLYTWGDNEGSYISLGTTGTPGGAAINGVVYNGMNSAVQWNLTGQVTRGSKSAPLAVQSGDDLVVMQGFGWDGTQNQLAGAVQILAHGTVSSGVVPGKIDLQTTDASGVFSTAFSIDESHSFLLNTATKLIDSSGNFTIPGTVQVSGSATFGAGANFGGTVGLNAVTWADNQTCTKGQITADANYIYVCVATNTVKRAALSSF